MLTHIVTIAVRPDTTTDQVDRMVAGLEALPDRIEAIRTYRVGRDLGLLPGNAAVVIIATFDTEDDMRTYVAHPEHQAVVTDLIDPISDTRLRVQFPSEER